MTVGIYGPATRSDGRMNSHPLKTVSPREGVHFRRDPGHGLQGLRNIVDLWVLGPGSDSPLRATDASKSYKEGYGGKDAHLRGTAIYQ